MAGQDDGSCEDTANSETRIVIEDRLKETTDEKQMDEKDSLQGSPTECAGRLSTKKGLCNKVLCSFIKKHWKCAVVIVVPICVIMLGIIGYFIVDRILLQEPGLHTDRNNSSTIPIIQENDKNEPKEESFPYQRPMENIRFDLGNSNYFGLYYSEGSQPILTFRDDGCYNISIQVQFDEESCSKIHPPGDIHLSIERAEDRSKVGKDFTDSFISHPPKAWTVFGIISTKVKMQKGNGLRIITDYRDCIVEDKTKLTVKKLS